MDKVRALSTTSQRNLRFEILELRRVLSSTQPLEFHMLALVYPEVQLPLASASMSQAAIDAVIDGMQVELPTLLNQLAGDQITARVHVEIADRALDELHWTGTNYEWVAEHMISEELDQFTRSGWYDHVFVVHGLYGVPFAPTAIWGGGALARYGMSMASINVNPNSGTLGHGTVPGSIHEWIHGLEVQYFNVLGVSTGQTPNGDSLDLHDGEKFGYQHNTDGRPEWSAWYRDFLTDNIRNVQSDGSNTGLGLGPDAWALGVPRTLVPFTPGSPLEFQEISDLVAIKLSDAYWPSASTEWGQIHRNATVYGNPIVINGVGFQHGVGIHANGEILVNLLGKANRFQSWVGVNDDIANGFGSVVFQVYGDGQLLYDSGIKTSDDDAVYVDVSVRGVEQLLLVVSDAGDGINSDHGVWADSRFIPYSGDYLSNVRWDASSTGYGYIILDDTIERNPILINEVHYGKGVGVHANGELVVDVNGEYSRFSSIVGVDDDIAPGFGSVRFLVYGDDQLLYQSPRKTGADGASSISVDISGVNELRLVINDAGDGGHSDHGVWADARLEKALADFDFDAAITGSDFLRWQLGFGTASSATKEHGDADNDMDVDEGDLAVWEGTYGQVETVPLTAAIGSESIPVEVEPVAIARGALATPRNLRLNLDTALSVDVVDHVAHGIGSESVVIGGLQAARGVRPVAGVVEVNFKGMTLPSEPLSRESAADSLPIVEQLPIGDAFARRVERDDSAALTQSKEAKRKPNCLFEESHENGEAPTLTAGLLEKVFNR